MVERRQLAVISGASSGIGKAAAGVLLKEGWCVIGIGRDPERTPLAERELQAIADDARDVEFFRADLSVLAEVTRVVGAILGRIDRLDVLVNNAGGVVGEFQRTPEGYETTFAGNHLGPFLLTGKLLPAMLATVPHAEPGSVRIVNVASSAHRQFPRMNWDDLGFTKSYSSGEAYCQAKLANMLFTHELAKRVAAEGVVVHALHPGIVASNFGNDSAQMREYMASQRSHAASAEHAGTALAWVATAAEPGSVSGRYWFDRAEEIPSVAATDSAEAQRLWEVSDMMVSAFV